MNLQLTSTITAAMWAGAVLGQTFAQSGIRDAAEKSIPVSLSLRTKSRAMYWLESTAAIVSVLTGMLARSKNFSLIVLSACLLVIQTSIIMSQLSKCGEPELPGKCSKNRFENILVSSLELVKIGCLCVFLFSVSFW